MLVLVTAALTPLLLQEGEGGLGPTAAARRQAVEEYQEAALELARQDARMRPWRAQPGDAARTDGHLGGFDGFTYGDWLGTLDDVELTLTRLDLAELPAAARYDAEWLVDWIHSEKLWKSHVRPLLTDPWYYTEGVRASLRASLPADVETTDARAFQTLVARLEGVPAVWQGARWKIKSSAQVWVTGAIAHAAGIERDIQRLYRPLAKLPFVDAESRARLEAACDAAEEATRDFGEWLGDLARRVPREPPHLDPTRWLEFLERATGRSMPADRLRSVLLTRIGGHTGRAVECPAAGVPETADAEAVTATAKAFLARLEREVREQKLLAPPGPDLRVGVREPALAWITRNELERIGPDRWLLAFALPEPTTPKPARERCLALLSRPAIEVASARLGPAGECYYEWANARSTSVARVRFASEARRVAFGLWTADWATELAGGEDSAFAGELQRALALEAARLNASLAWHGLSSSLEEAIEGFQRDTGADRSSAEREVVLCTRDPLRGAGYLVYLDTLTLELHLAREGEPRLETVRRTAQVLLQHPNARLPELLDELPADR